MKQITAVMIGDSGSGKTSVIKSVTQKSFREDIGITIGVDYARLKDDEIDIQIWDTAGLDKFDSLTKSYYHIADVIIIVYDLSKPETYDSIFDKWIPQVSMKNENAHLIIVGNKSDKSDDFYPNSQDTKHFRVSAKEKNCSCIFEYIKELYIPKKEHIIKLKRFPKYIAPKRKCY